MIESKIKRLVFYCMKKVFCLSLFKIIGFDIFKKREYECNRQINKLFYKIYDSNEFNKIFEIQQSIYENYRKIFNRMFQKKPISYKNRFLHYCDILRMNKYKKFIKYI